METRVTINCDADDRFFADGAENSLEKAQFVITIRPAIGNFNPGHHILMSEEQARDLARAIEHELEGLDHDRAIADGETADSVPFRE